MKKFSLALIALSVAVASAGAMAATTIGGKGTISFKGDINNDACTVNESENHVIAFEMGTVSIKDMGTPETPAAGRQASKNITLNVNCNAGTKVAMIFDPTSGGSGQVTTNKKVLALDPGNGAAVNVGIALLDSTGALIDLSSRDKSIIKTDLKGLTAAGGNTTLSFSAAYVTTGELTSVKAGHGNATLPFILEYE